MQLASVSKLLTCSEGAYHPSNIGAPWMVGRPTCLQNIDIEIRDTFNIMTSEPSINLNHRTEHHSERALSVTALGQPRGEAVNDRPEQRQ